eukprot:tig00000093_g3646.t1
MAEPSSTDASAADEAQDRKTTALLAWMREKGFQLHDAVTIKRIPGRGRAVVATGDLPADAQLFVVPRGSLLLGRTCRAKKSFPWKKLKGNSWNPVIVALIVEHAAGAASEWFPYIDVLPEELTTPVFWAEEERRGLRGTAVEARVGLEEIRGDFRANVLPLLRASREHLAACAGAGAVERLLGEDAAAEEALWRLYLRFGSIVGAYSFVLEDSGEVAMCPIADILNAETGRNNARLFHEEGGALAMRTTRPVEAGEELLNTYGDLPNAELLRRYGYVDVPNGNDCAELRGAALRRALEARGLMEAAPPAPAGAPAAKKAKKEADPAAALAARRRRAARALLDDDFPVPLGLEEVPARLLCAVALFCVPPSEFDARAPAVTKLFEEGEGGSSSDEEGGPEPPSFPPDAEGAARAVIREAVDAQLAEYAGEEGEDEAGLAGAERGEGPGPEGRLRPEHAAMVVRAGERRALRGLRALLASHSCA